MVKPLQELFASIADAVTAENGELAERLKGRKENYTAFLKIPRDIRKNICTTNSVGLVNAWPRVHAL